MALFADRYKMERLDAIATFDLGDKRAFQADAEDEDEEDDDDYENSEQILSKKRKNSSNNDNYSPEGSNVNGSSGAPQKPHQLPPQNGFVSQRIHNLLQASGLTQCGVLWATFRTCYR